MPLMLHNASQAAETREVQQFLIKEKNCWHLRLKEIKMKNMFVML